MQIERLEPTTVGEDGCISGRMRERYRRKDRVNGNRSNGMPHVVEQHMSVVELGGPVAVAAHRSSPTAAPMSMRPPRQRTLCWSNYHSRKSVAIGASSA